MKLEKILDDVNSLEKNSFLKIIDNIKSCNPKNSKEIDRILSDGSDNLKGVESANIAKIFELTKDEFAEIVKRNSLIHLRN
jgi:vacuolar-type H+-ATPase subunit H